MSITFEVGDYVYIDRSSWMERDHREGYKHRPAIDVGKVMYIIHRTTMIVAWAKEDSVVEISPEWCVVKGIFLSKIDELVYATFIAVV